MQELEEFLIFMYFGEGFRNVKKEIVFPLREDKHINKNHSEKTSSNEKIDEKRKKNMMENGLGVGGTRTLGVRPLKTLFFS